MRRRWRAVGLVGVLLMGALLVVVVTDRGHDPEWSVRTSLVEELSFSTDGRVVYALAREGGQVARLEARSGQDGGLLWQSPLSAPRALVRAGAGEVAVATDFPRAFLTAFDEDGTARYQFPLEGNPKALGIEGGVVVLALQAKGNPVLVLEDGHVVREHRFAAVVNSLDIRGGRLAVGTAEGQLVVFDPNGARLVNASLPLAIRSVRLTADGASVVVGGSDPRSPVFAGGVALIDVAGGGTLRWTSTTSQMVGLVDVDASGQRVLAVEPAPPGRIHMLDAADGRESWIQAVGDGIPRDDAGALGGAAISPDGAVVIVVSPLGPVRAFDARTGDPAWTYGTQGATIVSFARDAPGIFVTNGRLVQNGPYDALLLFLPGAEPTTGRLPIVAAALTLVAAFAVAVVVGVGFWRLRRSW